MVVVFAGFERYGELTSGDSTDRFDEMALGDDNTAVTQDDTALGNELVTGDMAAKTGGDVTGTTETTVFTDDTMQWVTTWTALADRDVWELVVRTTGDLTILLRQVFGKVLSLRNGDNFTLTVKDQITLPDNDTDGTLPDQAISHKGVANSNKLALADEAAGIAVFDEIAFGTDDGTLVTMAAFEAAAQPGLGEEFIDADLERGASVTTITREQTNTSGGQPNDTTVWTRTVTVTGATGGEAIINEDGVVDSSVPPTDDADGDDTTPNLSGNFLCREIYTKPLNLIDTDTYTKIWKIIEV